MKNFLLLTFSLVLCLKLSAQSYFSVAHQVYFSSITQKAIKASEGNYFVIGTCGGSEAKYNPFVFCVNDSGNILFEKTLFLSATIVNYVVTDIVKTADSNFVCIGHGDLCDVGFGEVYAEKFDALGTTIWSKVYQFNSFHDSNHHLAELPNGNFAFVLEDNLFLFNSVGDSLSTVTLANDSIQSIALTPDNYLLIGYKNLFEKRNLSGSYVSSKSFQGGVDNIVVEDVNKYVFSSSTLLYRTDSMFATIDSNDLQPSITKINAIALDASGFHLLDNQKIIHVNNAFAPDTATLNIYAPLQINDILTDSNKLLIIGDEYSYNVPSQPLVSCHSVVKSYDLLFNTQPENDDAGVIDVSSDSVKVFPVSTGFSATTVVFNLYATVKNFGTDTLHDVSLNFQIVLPVIICNLYDVSVNASGLNIAPQDTARIYLGSHTVGYNIAPPAQFNVCVWSSAPNKHIDIDHANDRSCKALSPIYVISVEENSPLSNLQIAPNPITSSVQITIPDLKSPITISLTDISGKEIRKETIDKTTFSLSLSEINAGMYFLQFSFGNQFIVKKIIKQ